jgi:hypothetical protein
VITGEGNNREEHVFSSEHKITWIELLNSTKKKLLSKTQAEGSAAANVKLLPEEQADEGQFWMDVESPSDLSKELLAEKILAWNALAGDDANHEKIFREMRKLSKLIMREKSHTLSVVGSRDLSTSTSATDQVNMRNKKVNNSLNNSMNSIIASRVSSSGGSATPSIISSPAPLNTNSASSTTATTSTTLLANKTIVLASTMSDK